MCLGHSCGGGGGGGGSAVCPAALKALCGHYTGRTRCLTHKHMHVQALQLLVTCHSTASKQPNLLLNTADCQIAAALVAFAPGHRLRKTLFGFLGWCFAVVMLTLQAAASRFKAGCTIAYA